MRAPWVAARDREKLEKLCCYAARSAVAESRLVELADGRIGYALKRRWRDGTTAVVMTKGVLMERLCALVPKPRKHLVTYHGVLAPASGLRPKVVPKRVEEKGEAGGCRTGPLGESMSRSRSMASWPQERCGRESRRRRVAEAAGGAAGVSAAAGSAWWGRRRGGLRRYSWAELLQRAFGIDVLVCPKCSGGPAGAGGDPRPGGDRAGAADDGATVVGGGAGGVPSGPSGGGRGVGQISAAGWVRCRLPPTDGVDGVDESAPE